MVKSTGKYSECHLFKDLLHSLLSSEKNLEGLHHVSLERCALSRC